MRAEPKQPANGAQTRLRKRPLPTGADRLRRAAWRFIWLVFFRPSPTPLHAWRCFLLRLFGAKIGPGAHPYPSARVWAPWNLEMAQDSCLADGVDCYCVDRISLGARAIVSQRAFLCSASHEHGSSDFALVSGPIHIGADAWIAAEAFVGPGVVVSEGAVVAARAVVVRDVAPHAIVAGNPARVVGERPGRDAVEPDGDRQH